MTLDVPSRPGLWRWVGRIAAALVAIIVAAMLAGAFLLWRTLPGGDLTQVIPGLSQPVRIALDQDGIPRIHAANENDAAAALGFLHARERLFQMDLMRRAASGTLSELAGPATLPIDRFMRALGIRASAEAIVPTLSPQMRGLFDAYARGVNAWIGRRGRFACAACLVFGAPAPWTPTDSLLWGKTMALYLSGNWRVELARLHLSATMPQSAIDALWPDESGPGHPEAALQPSPQLGAMAGKLAALVPTFPAPFTQPDRASNGWVVAGSHSATGAPLLAGDPHLGFSMPGIWYLARIETPGHVLVGATAPGVPLLVLGHNGRIAWTFTTTGADTEDLFVEQPVGADAYQTPDGSRPFGRRDEVIHVRGAADEVLHVRTTRHGPIVSDLVNAGGRQILALSMAALQSGDSAASGLYALNRANSVREAGLAAPQISAPVQNLLVADAKHIGLFVTGRVPVRRAGDGSRPADGASGLYDWIGFASGEQLPTYVDPPSGRLINANERVAPASFPVFLGRDWYGDFRARRIRTLLGAAPKATLASFAAMQVDVVDPLAVGVLPRLLRVAPASVLSRSALTLLRGWDGSMTAGAPQPLIFNAWMRVFEDRLRARVHVSTTGSAALPPGPDIIADALTPSREARWCGMSCDTMLGEALGTATSDVAARFGTDPAAWRWGAVHPAVFADPLLRAVPLLGRLTEGRIPSPGDEATVDRGGFGAGSFDNIHGASYRGVYDLSDLEQSRFVVAPGQSGNPVSRLSRNFLQRWRNGATVMISRDAGPHSTHITLEP